MQTRLVIGVLLILASSTTPLLAQQNATIVGTVTDATQSVLPGVTVTATDVASGRESVGVSDERGAYRLLNLPPGRYRISASLDGFDATTVEVELLVGQQATLPFVLRVGGITEETTVVASAPLVNLQSSQVGGNVDRRQMEDLPLSGRNWMELSLQVKGVTANAVTDRPGVASDEQFQLNLDGQQVTQKNASSSFGQPKFSREAIAEFQIVTNMFDITQGRSTGMQVQAISKSGTNTLTGSTYGYFRDDRFNSKDFIANRVLPYANQQVGGAVGGPILRDRLHYFGSYEYEREPNTLVVQPNALIGQRFDIENTVEQHSVMARVDHAISTRDRVNYRYSQWNSEQPFQMATTAHPTYAGFRTREAKNLIASWSRVLSSQSVQELRLGYNRFAWANQPVVPALANVPVLRFPTVNIGSNRDWPSGFQQNILSARYDLTSQKGRHEFKIGGEFLASRDTGEWHLLERGEFRFASTPADMNRRFPADAWDDPSRWDLSGLDGMVQQYDQSFGDFTVRIPRPQWAIWFGDTWRLSDRLTINYGIRWDDDWGATAPPDVTTTVPFAPFNGPLFKHDIRDHDNIAPRVGFTFAPTAERDLVIRGGSGLYYGSVFSNITYSQQRDNGQRIVTASFPNDGRPGFIQDPRRGVTADQILDGSVPLPPLAARVIAHDFEMPYTWQSSIGFQKRLTEVLGVEADLLHWVSKNNPRGRDINLFFDPATGYNLNPSVAGRPDPAFGEVLWMESSGSSDYLALASAITRRFQGNFQAGVTHTVMFYKHDDSTNWQIAADNQFDLDGEWARSEDFQRNTLRAYLIYRLPWDVQMSGSYAFGSGNYFATSINARPYNKPGTNRLNLGAPIAIPEDVRDRFDGPDVIATGEVVPRNALKGEALHKVDMRLAKTVRFGRAASLMLQAEVFNLLNHRNIGAYNGIVSAADFGAPRQAAGNAFAPRTGQLGVRIQF